MENNTVLPTKGKWSVSDEYYISGNIFAIDIKAQDEMITSLHVYS